MATVVNKTAFGKHIHRAVHLGMAATLITMPMIASAYSLNIGDEKTSFSIGGYAKLSMSFTGTDSGQLSGTFGKASRDFYIPLATPVGNGDASQQLNMTARESRLNMKGKTEIEGHKVGMYLEMDTLTTTEGNEVVSNSTAFRLRHSFITFDNWLFGQTWSTFMDTGALPESVDFLAAVEGTVFIRQPQVRYTQGGFQVALENPSNFVSGIAADRRDFSTLPDLAANYKITGDWGHLRVNGLARQISVEEKSNGGINDETQGYGLGLTGKIKLGLSDDIRFSINYGDGMGRYTSVAMVKDAMILNGQLETVKSVASFAAYRHAWSSKSRSNLIYSQVDIDNPTGAAATENKKGSSITVNYFYSPVKQVSLGVMYLAGERQVENGDSGKINRIQASAKYTF